MKKSISLYSIDLCLYELSRLIEMCLRLKTDKFRGLVSRSEEIQQDDSNVLQIS